MNEIVPAAEWDLDGERGNIGSDWLGISDDINSKKAYKRGKNRFEMGNHTLGKFKPKTRVTHPLTDLFQMAELQTHNVAPEHDQLIDPGRSWVIDRRGALGVECSSSCDISNCLPNPRQEMSFNFGYNGFARKHALVEWSCGMEVSCAVMK